jgi:biotin carboxyl carrier protein
MKIIAIINDESFEVDLTVDPLRENNFIARIGNRELSLFVPERKPRSLTLSVDGRVGYYEFYKDKARLTEAVHNCRSYKIDVKNPQQDQLEKLLEEFGESIGGTLETTILAPMPGKILGLSVKPDDKVEVGQMVLVLEAMKMENEISSMIEGKVRTVHVKVGDTVNADDLLVEFYPADK